MPRNSMGLFLARWAARQVAATEDREYFLGSDHGQPDEMTGLCYAVVDNSRVTTLSGIKRSVSQVALDNLRQLRTVIDGAALGAGAYYCHPSMERLLYTFNTTGDKPFETAGGRPTLDGYPVRWVHVMPPYTAADVAETVYFLFGDASYGYLTPRGGVRIDTSAQAGFTSDEILFRVIERFDVGLLAAGAMAGLQTAA